MDKDERTRIRIQGPLPMSVSSTLIGLLSKAWPDGAIEPTEHWSGLALQVVLPEDETAEDVDKEFARTIREANKSDFDGEFNGFRQGDDGAAWLAFAPPEELCLHLGNVAHAIFTSHKDAINYVTWGIRTGTDQDDPAYQLTIVKDGGKSPDDKRKEAEAEVERLKAILDAHGVTY